MNQLSQLPLAEELELVQYLWKDIHESGEQLPVQNWQRELVAVRRAELCGQEEESGLTLKQVWEEVDRRRGS